MLSEDWAMKAVNKTKLNATIQKEEKKETKKKKKKKNGEDFSPCSQSLSAHDTRQISVYEVLLSNYLSVWLCICLYLFVYIMYA